MTDSGTRESGDFKNKRANTMNLDDGACSSSLSSCLHAKRECAEALTIVERFQDPRTVFCDGLMTSILGKLDVRSIATAREVNSEWLTVASDDKLWESKCVELWQDKAHIPRMSKVPGLSKMKATSLSIIDGERDRITLNDLCDHAWDFHFCETAPSYWRNLDPYWGGSGSPMRRYFHPSGIITAGPDDKLWGDRGSSFTIFTSLLHDGRMGEHYVMVDDWAEMNVVRKSDWSWVLSNHLYCYTSIPDATDDDKVQGTGPLYPPVW